MSGSTTLNGFLQTTTTQITAAQLLALLGSPIQLAGPNSPTQAALLRSLIVSLRYGTTPFTNPTGRGGACVCYGSGLPAFGNGGSTPSFPISAVGNASGGNTTYTVPLLNGSGNQFAGFQGTASFCTHGANNGNFVVVSSSNGSLVLANTGGLAEAPVAGSIVLNYPSAAGGGLPGGGSGIGDVNDLFTQVLQANQSTVKFISVPGFQGATSQIAGAPITLGNPLALLFNPAQLAAGDSSLLITTEFLVVPL